jgi:hypothetical protein
MELMPMSDADTDHSVKPDVQKITVQVTAPRGGDPGRVTTGFYTVIDNVLTMTDASGIPIRRGGGDHYTRKLEPGENPRVWAGIYTKEIRGSIRTGSATDGHIDTCLSGTGASYERGPSKPVWRDKHRPTPGRAQRLV